MEAVSEPRQNDPDRALANVKTFWVIGLSARYRDGARSVHSSTQHNGLIIHPSHAAIELSEVGIPPGEEGDTDRQIFDDLPQGPSLHEARRAYPSED